MPKKFHPHSKKPPKPPKPPKHPKDLPFATRLFDVNFNTSLLVNGSAAPVEYALVPEDDIIVTELALIFEANGQLAFGDNFVKLPALVNGIEIEIQSFGEVVTANFKATRDLVEYASPGGFYTEGSGTFIVKATRQFSQGLKLRDRYGDFIKLTVQDDLTALSYGVASVLGYTD